VRVACDLQMSPCRSLPSAFTMLRSEYVRQRSCRPPGCPPYTHPDSLFQIANIVVTKACLSI
jgi:hypothetical protein